MERKRLQTVMTYSSSSGGDTYLYDVVQDGEGGFSVRNIRGPRGLITDSLTSVPSSVASDITSAIEDSTLLLNETSVVSGDQDFTGQTSITVAIAPGLLNTADYRVALTSSDGALLRVENKTTTSFDIVASSAYGDPADPATVSWVVLVSTVASSVYGGTLTYAAGETKKAVAFATALASSSYRVILSNSDFFYSRVVNQTVTGFEVEISFDASPGSVTVGYDVFV